MDTSSRGLLLCTLNTVIGALLGTQNGRDVEIVNSFDLATNARPGSDLGQGEAVGVQVDLQALNDRKEQCE